MRTWMALGLLAALLLAGCSSGGGDKTPPVDVTADTGGIRGLVVDESIAPIAGATITLNGGPDAGKTAQSGADGRFNFTRLQPGEYFLSVTKPGYVGGQVSASVVAGDAEPKIVKALLTRITTATPYVDHFKLDGYYECAFSAGDPSQPVITDSCDFGYRTAWDFYNQSAPDPAPKPLPVARAPVRSINTQFIDIPEDTFAIVQEAFWDDERVPAMMVLLSSTPIDNGCDCSETDYLDVTQPSPTHARIDRFDEAGKEAGKFPNSQTVASRGFLSWETTSSAQGLTFQVITSLFHNYVPPAEWTFETRENFPVG